MDGRRAHQYSHRTRVEKYTANPLNLPQEWYSISSPALHIRIVTRHTNKYFHSFSLSRFRFPPLSHLSVFQSLSLSVSQSLERVYCVLATSGFRPACLLGSGPSAFCTYSHILYVGEACGRIRREVQCIIGVHFKKKHPSIFSLFYVLFYLSFIHLCPPIDCFPSWFCFIASTRNNWTRAFGLHYF